MALNPDEVHVLDGNAEFLGVPSSRLMENAGFSVAETIKKKYKLLGKKVVILSGPGNNGGDGFVIARNLLQYCQVQVALIKPAEEIKTDIARANFEKIKRLSITVYDSNGLRAVIRDADIIVDALLGVGAKGEINDPYKSWIAEINKSGKTIVSVDVPSGIGTSVQVEPAMTVTFHDIKEGMDKKNSGDIIVADIGIPKEAETYTGPGEFVFYPVPVADSHKGDNGRVLIVGGGPYTGAPALAGIAAYRTGVDLVRIVTPKQSYPIIASYSPNFIALKASGEDKFVEDDVPLVLAQLKNSDSLVIGPGLGNAKETIKAVQLILSKCEKPMLIDADAIAAAGERPQVLKNATGVITPHVGEFYELTGKKLDNDFAKKCKHVLWTARDLRMTILLKGKVDIVSDGIKTKLNKTGNPAMTVGGTGDVLAGMVGALLAKGVSPFNAARIGAFTNGYAGDLAFMDKSYGTTATDVAEKIPEVLRQFLK